MDNILEKLHASQKSPGIAIPGSTLSIHAAQFPPKDKRIHDHGLISILKQLHDELDAAVFDAYH